MRRSRILDGKKQQRSRAKQRGRLDRARGGGEWPGAEPHDELERWLSRTHDIEWCGGQAYAAAVDIRALDPRNPAGEPMLDIDLVDRFLAMPALAFLRRLTLIVRGGQASIVDIMRRLGGAPRPWLLEELIIGSQPRPARRGDPFNAYPFEVSDIRAFLEAHPRLYLIALNDTVVPLPRKHAEAPHWPEVEHALPRFDVADAAVDIRALVGRESIGTVRTAIGRALWSPYPPLRRAALDTIATLGQKASPFLSSLELQLEPDMVDDRSLVVECLQALGIENPAAREPS